MVKIFPNMMDKSLELKEAMENIFPHQMGLILRLEPIKFQPQLAKKNQANDGLNGL